LRLAVLKAAPDPPAAIVVDVIVRVLVVVWVRVPLPTTEFFRSPSMLTLVLPVIVLPTSLLVAQILPPLLALSHWPGPDPSGARALALPPLFALTAGDCPEPPVPVWFVVLFFVLPEFFTSMSFLPPLFAEAPNMLPVVVCVAALLMLVALPP